MTENELKVLQPVVALVVFAFLLIWESALPAYAYLRGRWLKRLTHIARNGIIATINALLGAILFSKMWVVTCIWVQENQFGLLNWMKLGTLWHAIMAIVLLDLWMYWWHLFNHRIPFLWRFHRMHHSDPHLDVTTGARFHIGEMTFSALLRVPVLMAIGPKLEELLLYEIVMFSIVQFHHANVQLPALLDKCLRVFIVTPAMHKVHHSRIPKEMNSNYTSLFSVWDRLWGSFCLREDPISIHIGLNEYDDDTQQTVKGMFLTPLNKNKREE